MTKVIPQARPHLMLVCGIFLVSLLVLLTVFAPYLAPQDPELMSLANAFESPSFKHPFGLDENGSDVFAKVLYGGRVSLTVALSVISISALVGLVIGSAAGYCGGRTEHLLMRAVDMVHAFPSFLLALTLIALRGPSLGNLIIALCITSWTSFARLVRGEVLHLKERDFVQAARSLGSSHLRIVMVHIWPNLTSLLFVQATFAIAATIVAEAGLSFLGLGVPVSLPTWGSLLNSGRRIILDAPHVSFAAGSAIMLTVLGFHLLGDGLRDLLDPRRGSRARSL